LSLLSPRQADVVGYVALTIGEGHVQRSIGAVDQADVAKEGVLTSSLVEVDWKPALGGGRAMACRLACTPRTRSALLSCVSSEFLNATCCRKKGTADRLWCL